MDRILLLQGSRECQRWLEQVLLKQSCKGQAQGLVCSRSQINADWVEESALCTRKGSIYRQRDLQMQGTWCERTRRLWHHLQTRVTAHFHTFTSIQPRILGGKRLSIIWWQARLDRCSTTQLNPVFCGWLLENTPRAMLSQHGRLKIWLTRTVTRTAFTEGFLGAKHSRYFTWFHPHNNPRQQGLLIPPFYR